MEQVLTFRFFLGTMDPFSRNRDPKIASEAYAVVFCHFLKLIFRFHCRLNFFHPEFYGKFFVWWYISSTSASKYFDFIGLGDLHGGGGGVVTCFSSVHSFAKASRTFGVFRIKTDSFVQTITFKFVGTANDCKFQVSTGIVVERIIDTM